MPEGTLVRMTRMSVHIGLLAIMWAFVQTAHAARYEILDLRPGRVTYDWEARNVLVTQVREGVRLQATGTGSFVARNVDFSVSPQMVTLFTKAPAAQRIMFSWHLRSDGETAPMYHFPFSVPAGLETADTPILLHTGDSWRPGQVDRVGLLLPPGSDFILERMEFVQWSFGEQIGVMLRSFWNMQSYNPHSINFVWGPQFAFTPPQLRLLWSSLPPNSLSGTFVVNVILVVLLVLLWIHATLRHRKHGLPQRFLAVLLATWVVFDVRMGAEFLSWMAHDMRTYVFAEEGEKTLRDRGDFYAFAAFAAPLVADRERYVFFAQHEWPFVGAMRYATFPSVPDGDEEDDTWVIYDRPDIVVGPTGQLMIGQNVLSDPGRVIGEFGEGSFIFRVSP